jgi:hypothetical protein
MSSTGSVSPIPELGETQSKSGHATSTSMIGGVDIEINETPADAKALTPLYQKEDRMNLSDDKRNELYDRATKNAHTKYETISLNLNVKAKLDNTYNLSMLIGKTCEHFIMHNLHNVFTVLFPDPNDETKILEEKDLFRDYQPDHLN